MTNRYILGPNGEQMTEITYNGGSPTWAHTNVPAGGVTATYLNDGQGPHYRLADWLGTTRVQVNSAGSPELSCQSLPFGDPQVPCTSPTATEQFYTGQERDSETGNDFFQARYYASNTGRFLSPDPSGLAYVNPADPQTFNLYGYVENNPLRFVDPSGQNTCTLNGIASDCGILQNNDGVQCLSNCFMSAINSNNLSLAADLSTGSYYSGGFPGWISGSSASDISGANGSYTMTVDAFLLQQGFMSYAWGEATSGGQGYSSGTAAAPNSGGRGGPNKSNQCTTAVLRKDGLALGLDVAGDVAAAIPGAGIA